MTGRQLRKKEFDQHEQIDELVVGHDTSAPHQTVGACEQRIGPTETDDISELYPASAKVAVTGTSSVAQVGGHGGDAIAVMSHLDLPFHVRPRCVVF
jgi:hypothetical protein